MAKFSYVYICVLLDILINLYMRSTFNVCKSLWLLWQYKTNPPNQIVSTILLHHFFLGKVEVLFCTHSLILELHLDESAKVCKRWDILKKCFPTKKLFISISNFQVRMYGDLLFHAPADHLVKAMIKNPMMTNSDIKVISY